MICVFLMGFEGERKNGFSEILLILAGIVGFWCEKEWNFWIYYDLLCAFVSQCLPRLCGVDPHLDWTFFFFVGFHGWKRVFLGFTHCSSLLEFQVSLGFSFWDFLLYFWHFVHHREDDVYLIFNRNSLLIKLLIIIIIMWWRIRLRFLLWLLWAVLLLFMVGWLQEVLAIAFPTYMSF